ncbi:amino acid ABC transporter permease [Defluviimonas aestuarii]|uniref:amino acid ABC transporter permease n=1 Tax=Albidovulum aestuarii TaxID=1130726 RepID=UPI00249CC62B|nr:amino acid ABC transporter permease [Defluviimonas aestuarii]MDI3335108.1 amino acid ABC transporter permease [Defluviimonas aestuarii]
MHRLARIRPSNLVILTVLPFILYLFTTVPNYRRSITAIVGIEPGAGVLLRDWLLVMAVLVAGIVWPLLQRRGKADGGRGRIVALAALIGNAALAVALAAFGDLSALASSIVANALDPVTSEMVVRAVTPRQLTPEGTAYVAGQLDTALWIYAALTGALAVAALVELGTGRKLGRWVPLGLLVLNGTGLVYMMLAAHIGFASGLFTTLRAGIFAYLLAGCLGLTWAGLLFLTPSRSTTKVWGTVCAVALVLAGVLWMQPHESFVLTGSLDKRVAIVKGTPKSLVDAVRFGEFEGAPEREIGLRSTASNDNALTLIADGSQVSAALLPAELAPEGMPVLWQTSQLPDRFRIPAVFLFVGGLLLGVLTFSAHQHGRHPLSVSAEFFIDTVRGIPMLVIILFVGLPFAGALKDVSGGTIDMPNVLRGVIAIAIGYSAYLAEIFRAGIEAVPQGQVEAARSLGLNNYKVARLVVLPQALKIVIPPLGNEFIAILKDTSLLSILSVRDVTQRMREFQSASFLPFAPFNSAAILYVCLTLAAASLIASIERRYDVKRR